MLPQLALLLALFGVVSPADFVLPGGIKPCKNDANLNKCILQVSKDGIKKLSKGDPKYKIPSLTPLLIDKIVINQGDREQAYVNMTLTNCKLYGLDKAELAVSQVDIKKRNFRFVVKAKPVSILGDYVMEGKFLLVPIVGKGKCNMTLEDVEVDFGYPFTLEKKNGKEWVKLGKPNKKYIMGKAHFKFENLFNGDKTLGEGVNKMLNDNEKEITSQFGPALGDSLYTIMDNTFQHLSKTIPYENIFAKN